ncbi:MAG TPA: hypothetical protein VNL15_08250 [Dehalococcoidia bacterium]|nr:hypothetical protein [Dehalococcoidia bacterium]
MARFFYLLTLAFMGVGLFAACRGVTTPGTAFDNQTPEPTPASTPLNCEAARGVDRYRYAAALSFQSEGLRNAIVQQEGLNPVLTFFQNAELEGTVQTAERYTIISRSGGTELELRAVGNQRWLRTGINWYPWSESIPQELLLRPYQICESLAPSLNAALAGLQPRDEVVNGVPVLRYDLTAIQVLGFPDLLATADRDGGQYFVGAIWLVRDSGWPLRLELQSLAGSASLKIRIEFKDINDAAILVEPPVD